MKKNKSTEDVREGHGLQPVEHVEEIHHVDRPSRLSMLARGAGTRATEGLARWQGTYLSVAWQRMAIGCCWLLVHCNWS